MSDKIIFPAISFTKPGVYNYTVREITPSISNWKIDKQEYRVVITVEDNDTGQLTAKVDYPDGKIVFTNVYCKCRHKPTKPKIDVCKCFNSLPFPMFLFAPLQKEEFAELMKKNKNFFEQWEKFLDDLNNSSSSSLDCNCNDD